jgi:hypothetical protein
MSTEKTKESKPNHGRVDYPSARYFQIHFEFVCDELRENRRIIEDLQRQLCELLVYINKTDKTGIDNVIQISRPKAMLTSIALDKK